MLTSTTKAIQSCRVRRERVGSVIRGLSVGVLLALAACVVGCSPSTPEQVATPEARVKERAEERWTALVARDFEGAYAFQSPAYRKATSYERFRARFGDSAAWHGATVSSVSVGEEGDVANLVLILEYTAIGPAGESYPGRRGMKETWVRSEGEWWIASN